MVGRGFHRFKKEILVVFLDPVAQLLHDLGAPVGFPRRLERSGGNDLREITLAIAPHHRRDRVWMAHLSVRIEYAVERLGVAADDETEEEPSELVPLARLEGHLVGVAVGRAAGLGLYDGLARPLSETVHERIALLDLGARGRVVVKRQDVHAVGRLRRFAEVRAAESNWRAGVQPFHERAGAADEFKRLLLPPRFFVRVRRVVYPAVVGRLVHHIPHEEPRLVLECVDNACRIRLAVRPALPLQHGGVESVAVEENRHRVVAAFPCIANERKVLLDGRLRIAAELCRTDPVAHGVEPDALSVAEFPRRTRCVVA